MALKSRNKVSANFNMSSMTDIVFLLLIFFMLTFGIERHEELDLQLPQGNAKVTEKSATIAIHIQDVENEETKKPNLFIDIGNGIVPVEFTDIEDELKSAVEKFEGFKGISLYTDKTIDIEYIANIMLIASNNDYKIALVISEEE